MQTEPLYSNQLGKPASMDLHGMLLQSPVRPWLHIARARLGRAIPRGLLVMLRIVQKLLGHVILRALLVMLRIVQKLHAHGNVWLDNNFGHQCPPRRFWVLMGGPLMGHLLARE